MSQAPLPGTLYWRLQGRWGGWKLLNSRTSLSRREREREKERWTEKEREEKEIRRAIHGFNYGGNPSENTHSIATPSNIYLHKHNTTTQIPPGLNACLTVQGVNTHPWVGGHERVGSPGWAPVVVEWVWFADEGVVALIVHSGVDESAVHTPGAVPCSTHTHTDKHAHAHAPTHPDTHRHERKEGGKCIALLT